MLRRSLTFLRGKKRTAGQKATRKEFPAQTIGAQRTNEAGSVVCLFGDNDLRVHDNYALTMASQKAKELGVPLVCGFCFDFRKLAQPSLIGGFYRSGPRRTIFLQECVAALQTKLESFGGTLLIGMGLPEEHGERLCRAVNAKACFATTQYAPSEKRSQKELRSKLDQLGCSFETVWQTTYIHPDDLSAPVSELRFGLRWFFDEVQAAPVRYTLPYDCDDGRLRGLLAEPGRQGWTVAAKPDGENTVASTNALVNISDAGADFIDPFNTVLPSLAQMGYGTESIQAAFSVDAPTGYTIHTGGEEAAFETIDVWLNKRNGLDGYVVPGKDSRNLRVDMAGKKAARISPWLATGALSPRTAMRLIREHTDDNARNGAATTQYREAVLRFARRDFWHIFGGLKLGDTLFYPYGPTPEHTDDIPDYRLDEKVIRRWCAGLTGIPFCDASMKELNATGFVANEGRQALSWLISMGYGQDWRVGAEWFERSSLDYDCWTCWGEFARCSKLIKDDFGEQVYSANFLAHRNDQTGIFIRTWLPELASVPSLYVHRPHVMTKRMQEMHSVKIGGADGSYPLPIKLWDGAQHELGPSQLHGYFATEEQRRVPGWGEAPTFGTKLLPGSLQTPHSSVGSGVDVNGVIAGEPAGGEPRIAAGEMGSQLAGHQ